MAISSTSLPIYEETCREWLRRLAADPSDEALALRDEARNLLAFLEVWRKQNPTPEDRMKTGARVLDFHGRARTYHGRRKPGP